MKPGAGRVRVLSWFTAAALLSTMSLSRPAPAAAKAGKGGKPAAKGGKPAGKKDSAPSASTESKPSTPYEVPSPAGAETPPASASASVTATSTATSTSTSTSTATSVSTETPPKPVEMATTEIPKEVPKDPLAAEPPKETTPVSEPSTPPPAEVAPVVAAEPVPLYIEHLGPSTYPGRMRGIYGSSLWLEPSFHGLQWPVMARSGVGVSGMFWLDNGYEQIKRDAKGLPNSGMTYQQGRGLLRVTPTYTNGRLFIQGQVELVGNVCQTDNGVCIAARTVDTDDLWIRVGVWNSWDLKVGRFEGWELYHTGMGLDMYTLERQGAQQLGFKTPGGLETTEIYGVNFLHDRPSGLGVGYVAFHAYPSDTFRLELLGELGTDAQVVDDTVTADPTSIGYTYLGGRPSLIFDRGWMKLKLGGEYERRIAHTQNIDQTTGEKLENKLKRIRKGAGGSVQFIIDPNVEFGANGAIAWQDSTLGDDTLNKLNTFTRMSVGGFANLRLAPLWILGAGVNFAWQNDKFYFENSESPDYTAHLQAFGALQYLLAGQLYIRAVISYARADFVTSDASMPLWSNTMLSGRVRLMYIY